jgi:hypothetical protein
VSFACGRLGASSGSWRRRSIELAIRNRDGFVTWHQATSP